MRIALITPQPDHPLLAATTALLTASHQVVALDPGAPSSGPGASAGEWGNLADVYLLKARTPAALALARSLEERGAPVVNSAAVTALCQDRTAMARTARAAGLPFPGTRTVVALGELAGAGELRYPVTVKSRHSRRGDLVARVGDAGQLRALCAAWPDEPVIVQPFLPNSGWDQKLWVIAGEVFAARRRSELAGGVDGPTVSLAPGELAAGRADLALRVGAVFGLEVYGVDVIDVDGAPQIVDINAFPGIRGQRGAPEALAALALRAAGRGRVPHPR